MKFKFRVGQLQLNIGIDVQHGPNPDPATHYRVDPLADPPRYPFMAIEACDTKEDLAYVMATLRIELRKKGKVVGYLDEDGAWSWMHSPRGGYGDLAKCKWHAKAWYHRQLDAQRKTVQE